MNGKLLLSETPLNEIQLAEVIRRYTEKDQNIATIGFAMSLDDGRISKALKGAGIKLKSGRDIMKRRNQRRSTYFQKKITI